jgi:hypothetical protein
MRFYKEVWGIIWEFNGIGEFISFMIGRLLGVIIFAAMVYFFATCSGSKNYDYGKEKYPAEFYQY